jgi:hypothetical protein
MKTKKFWKTAHEEWEHTASCDDPTPELQLLCMAQKYSTFVVLHTLFLSENDIDDKRVWRRDENRYRELLKMETTHYD